MEKRLHAEGKALALEERNEQLEQQVAALRQRLEEVEAAATEQRSSLEQQLVAAQQGWAQEREMLVHKHTENRGKMQQAAREQVSVSQRFLPAFSLIPSKALSPLNVQLCWKLCRISSFHIVC
jgi:hypothetical protein